MARKKTEEVKVEEVAVEEVEEVVAQEETTEETEVEETTTEEETTTLNIKVLKPIFLHEDMKEYQEHPGDHRYEKGDIIKNVNEKYEGRLKNHPEYIEFL
jgi:hypothetical protein